jgi:hypothetical protein
VGLFLNTHTMATTIKYKDTSGNMQTVVFDLSVPIEVTVPNDNSEWTLDTYCHTDSHTVDYVGAQPKR